MNKIKLIFLTLFFSFIIGSVEARDVPVEFRAAAFFHSSKRFREVYGNVGPCYEIEAATHIYRSFEGWGNIDWFHKHKTQDEVTKSTVNILNVSFGAKYVYIPSERWHCYLGIGPSIGGIFLKNRSDGYKDNVSKFIIGGVVKIGADYIFPCGVFFDIFVDYLYQPVHFHTTVDIGGLKPGLGLGYKF